VSSNTIRKTELLQTTAEKIEFQEKYLIPSKLETGSGRGPMTSSSGSIHTAGVATFKNEVTTTLLWMLDCVAAFRQADRTW